MADPLDRRVGPGIPPLQPGKPAEVVEVNAAQRQSILKSLGYGFGTDPSIKLNVTKSGNDYHMTVMRGDERGANTKESLSLQLDAAGKATFLSQTRTMQTQIGNGLIASGVQTEVLNPQDKSKASANITNFDLFQGHRENEMRSEPQRMPGFVNGALDAFKQVAPQMDHKDLGPTRGLQRGGSYKGLDGPAHA